MSMIENTFKLKHKAVEKIVKYSNQMSLRTKIRQGYIVMIILFFFIFVLVVGLEIRNYSGKIIYSTMENQNQQIEKSIDYFIDDIIKLSEYPYVDSEVTALLEKSYQGDGESIVVKINDTAKLAHLLYKHVFYMNKRIDSVWLLAENNMENPAIVTRQNLNNHYNMKEEDWYNRVYSGNGTPFILGVHEDSGSTSNEKIVSVARSIVSPTDGSFLGMFVINIKANDFAALWYNGQADDRIIAVADKENHLIMNPNAAKEDDLETYIQSVNAKMPVNKRQTVKLGNEKYYLVITQLECIEGKIYQFYATKSATKGFEILYFVLLIGTLLIGAVFYLISYRISDKITKPLYQLVDSMREVSGGDFQIQTDKLNGELQILSTTFNKMTKRIDIMFWELTEKEKQKRDMELLALQAQINPHFLYNTLNSIQCVAEMQGAENVSNMLDAMISILHYTAESAGEIVAMEKELTFIQNYIKIINFRYFDRFSFLVQADDKVRNYGTLRFILQPIVENAIFHGFEADDLNALIEIKIVEKDQNLVIEITDNGRGMEEAKCAEILQHDSTERRGLNRIGIYNVNQRIKLYFGESYGIHIISKMGQFTKVIITMPRITAMGEKIDEKGIDC